MSCKIRFGQGSYDGKFFIYDTTYSDPVEWQYCFNDNDSWITYSGTVYGPGSYTDGSVNVSCQCASDWITISSSKETVQAWASAGNDYSTLELNPNFTVGKPTLSSATDITGSTAKIPWTRGSNAGKTTIYLYDSSGTCIDSYSSSSSSGTWSVSGLSPGQTYTYKGFATSPLGYVETGYTTTKSFTTTSFGNPSWGSGFVSVTDTTATLYWNIPSGTIKSEVWLWDADGSVDYYTVEGTGTTHTFTGLAMYHDYFATVRCNNGSMWSEEPQSPGFRTTITVAPPTNLHIDDITKNSCRVDWTNSTNGDLSHCRIYTSPSDAGQYLFFPNLTTSYCDVTGLSPGTDYWARVWATHTASGQTSGFAAEGFVKFTTLANVGAPTISLVEKTSNYITVSRSLGSNGVYTHYRVYDVNGNEITSLFKPDQTGSTVTFSGLAQNTTYQIKAWSTDSTNQSSSAWSNTLTVTTESVVKPTGVNFTDITNTSAKVNWTPGENNLYYDINWYIGNTLVGSATNVTGSSYTITGLTQGTSYNVEIQAKDAFNGNVSGWTAALYFKTTIPRPANWDWGLSIRQGDNLYNWTPQSGSGTFSVTAYVMPASKWNDFCSRINEFRAYMGLSAYSFTAATSGGDATRTQANQAVSAINAMGHSIAQVTSGEDIKASFFIELRDTLNSTYQT